MKVSWQWAVKDIWRRRYATFAAEFSENSEFEVGNVSASEYGSVPLVHIAQHPQLKSLINEFTFIIIIKNIYI